MKVWEAMSRTPAKVTPRTPLLVARTLFRETGARVLPVVEDEYSDKFTGFLTRVDVLLVTSQKSNILVKDVMRQHPIATIYDDLHDVFKIMGEFKVYGMPVVESSWNPLLKGIVTCRDIIRVLKSMGYNPKAKTVGEVMLDDNIDEMLVTLNERVNRVWSKFVYRGMPALIVVRSLDNRIPMGIVTPKDLIDHGRWFFHRESEQHITSPAKVQRVMTRGVVVATVDTPIDIVAETMVRNDFTLLPVIDDDGRVIGVISQREVIRAYIEGRIPGRVPIPPLPLPKAVEVEEKVPYLPSTQVLRQVMVETRLPPTLIGISAANIMRTSLPAIRIDDTVEHARREMLRRKTNYLLVVDENGNIIGAVSKRNMIYALGTRGPIWRRRIKDRFFIEYIMTHSIPRLSLETPLENIALEMMKCESDIAFITEGSGEIVGFVTKDDVINAFYKNYGVGVLVENLMTPRGLGIVHPHHSLHYVVTKMKALYLDALTVYDGVRVRGVISENRLPFVAFEDAVKGVKSRRIIWIRKLVRGAARLGRYIKVTPLVAADLMVPLRERVSPKDTVKRAIELMLKHNVDGLPVVDEGDVLGVICKNDIIRQLARNARVIVEEIPERKVPPTTPETRRLG